MSLDTRKSLWEGGREEERYFLCLEADLFLGKQPIWGKHVRLPSSPVRTGPRIAVRGPRSALPWRAQGPPMGQGSPGGAEQSGWGWGWAEDPPRKRVVWVSAGL